MMGIAMLFPAELAADKSIYVPTFSGTVRARYEFFPQSGVSAFKVRNLRLGVDGYVAPIMSYRGEVDFADWGKIVLIDAYIKLSPAKGLYFNLGQGRMPFTISAHRRPHEQYFVNRAFVSRHMGLRDVGLVGSYDIPKIPLTVQASFFNCSGTGENMQFYTKTFGYTVKLISQLHPYWYLSASTARRSKGIARNQDWDIGGYFHNSLWHVEAEYLRRYYVNSDFKPVNTWDLFVYRNFPIEKKMIGGIAGAIRYDYISDFSNGHPGEDHKLKMDFPDCHRLTFGATLSLMSKFQAQIRLDYEKYFFRKDFTPSAAEGDRLVFELIAHF